MGVRLPKILLAVGVAAGLAWGPGVSLASGPAATGGDQPAAWALTATDPVFGNFGLAVDPATNTVYAGGQAGGSLSVINALTGQITGTLTVAGNIIAAAVNPTTGTVYVTTEQAVDVVNPSTGQVVTSIPDAMTPRQVAVDPETNTIYVLNTSNVWVIDGSTNTVTTTIDLTKFLTGIAVDPVTNTIYVANPSADSVTVIDGATNTVTTTISGNGQSPRGITADPSTDKIYVANGAGTVSTINGKTNTITDTVDADARNGIAVDPQTDTIYTLDESGGLGGLSGRTNEFLLSSLFTTNDPVDTFGEDLVVDPAAGTIYAIDSINSTDGPSSASLAIVTSCLSHIVAAAGSNCAKVASDFEPNAVSFSSPTQGVVFGTTNCLASPCFQGALLATEDGGKQWSFLSPPPGLQIESNQPPRGALLFTSPDNGWLYGSWHTGNGGATWQRSIPEVTQSVLAMAASTSTVYVAVRSASGVGQLFATQVGATRWSRVPAVSGAATGLVAIGQSVWMTSPTHLFATSDGRHWHTYPARCPGTGYRLAGVTATSLTRLLLLCARPAGPGQTVTPKEVLFSANAGRTVRLDGPAPAMGLPEAFDAPPSDPSFITIAAGGAGADRKYWLYRSIDGGRNWTTQTFTGSPGESFRGLTYPAEPGGWFVLASPGPGTGNRLMHTTTNGIIWHRASL